MVLCQGVQFYLKLRSDRQFERVEIAGSILKRPHHVSADGSKQSTRRKVPPDSTSAEISGVCLHTSLSYSISINTKSTIPYENNANIAASGVIMFRDDIREIPAVIGNVVHYFYGG